MSFESAVTTEGLACTLSSASRLESRGLVLAAAPSCLLPVLSRASPSPAPLLPLLFRDLFLDFGFLGPACNHSALSSSFLLVSWKYYIEKILM